MQQPRNKNQIAIIIDWDNILINMAIVPPERFSFEEGFERFIHWLQKMGDIAGIFVFAPSKIDDGLEDFARKIKFWRKNFFIISCPKVSPAEASQDENLDKRRTINTTDIIIRTFGSLIIDKMPEVGHLCIGSGDKDFCQLAEKAKENGLKVSIMVSSKNSLSLELGQLADINSNGKPLIYLFSPTKTNV